MPEGSGASCERTHPHTLVSDSGGLTHPHTLVSKGRTPCCSMVAKRSDLLLRGKCPPQAPPPPGPLGSRNVEVPGEVGFPVAIQTLLSSGCLGSPLKPCCGLIGPRVTRTSHCAILSGDGCSGWEGGVKLRVGITSRGFWVELLVALASKNKGCPINN